MNTGPAERTMHMKVSPVAKVRVVFRRPTFAHFFMKVGRQSRHGDLDIAGQSRWRVSCL